MIEPETSFKTSHTTERSFALTCFSSMDDLSFSQYHKLFFFAEQLLKTSVSDALQQRRGNVIEPETSFKTSHTTERFFALICSSSMGVAACSSSLDKLSFSFTLDCASSLGDAYSSVATCSFSLGDLSSRIAACFSSQDNFVFQRHTGLCFFIG